MDELIKRDNVELMSCLLFDQPQLCKVNSDRKFGLLHLAATINGSKCFNHLLNTLDPNEPISLRDLATPLHFAVLSNQLLNAKSLLGKGASTNSQDSQGDTPLHFAVKANNIQMVILLCEWGALTTIDNNTGQSPIGLAQKMNLKEMLDYFN